MRGFFNSLAKTLTWKPAGTLSAAIDSSDGSATAGRKIAASIFSEISFWASNWPGAAMPASAQPTKAIAFLTVFTSRERGGDRAWLYGTESLPESRKYAVADRKSVV